MCSRRPRLGPHSLGLRADGPHALVGGTTGSGKSELLQAWVLALAAAHSPQRLTFVLVDYKGGAAFQTFQHLPHNVGLFTDLDPHPAARCRRRDPAGSCRSRPATPAGDQPRGRQWVRGSVG